MPRKRRRNSNNWDQTPEPFSRRRQSRRVGPSPPEGKSRDETLFADRGLPEPRRTKYPDPRQGSVLAPRRSELYSIESQYNYRSAFARYERALFLFPDQYEIRAPDDADFTFFSPIHQRDLGL